MRDQRRLAAIVSADVAGYSRLMGRDEGGTLAALKAHRRELIDPKIAEYGGRIVKTTGDGLLLEFPSVVEGVRCAVDVQRGMADRNAGLPFDQRIDFRIGINVGDIIIDGDDIFGDGVNVAARLQALAEPGGICVSRVVRDQVLDKLSFRFHELGTQQVKNISRPVEIYAVDLERRKQAAQDLPRPSAWFAALQSRRRLAVAAAALVAAIVATWALLPLWKTAPVAEPPVLSMAILPLTAPVGDPDASSFAQALTRDLATGIARKREYGSVYVVSAAPLAASANGAADPRDVGRKLNVRYVLEGDVLRVGTANTVNLRLVETTSGGQVWTQQETLQASDVVGESSARLRNLNAKLRNVIGSIEGQRVSAAPVSSLSPRELVLRAFEVGGKDASRTGMIAAGKLVDEALRRDPDLVPALVLRAALYNNQGDVDPDLARERVAREQDELTTRAVRLDASDPAAWSWRGAALEYAGRWDAALDANAIAIKLDPFESRWQMQRANYLIAAGRFAEALEVIDRALALEPSNTGTLLGNACEAHLLTGQTEQAIAECEKAVALSNHWTMHVLLAAAYANHGDMAKAAAARAEALRVAPGFTIGQLRAKRPAAPQGARPVEEILYAGLRKAGFTE